MKEEIEKSIKIYRTKLSEMNEYLKIPSKKNDLIKLEEQSSSIDFWNDQTKAKIVIEEIKSLKLVLDPFIKLKI